MKKLNSLEDVKCYLDGLALKNVNDFGGEEYLPLDDYFMGLYATNSITDIQLREFTLNDYMDGKITFEKMLEELKKYYH